MEQWRQFQVFATQLVICRGAILLIMTLQGHFALQKSRPVHTGQ